MLQERGEESQLGDALLFTSATWEAPDAPTDCAIPEPTTKNELGSGFPPKVPDWVTDILISASQYRE